MPRGGRSWSREVDLLDFAETAARAFVRLPSTVSFRAHTWPSFCFLLLCCGRSLPGLYGLDPPLASPLPIDLMRASGLVLDLALPKKKRQITPRIPWNMLWVMVRLGLDSMGASRMWTDSVRFGSWGFLSSSFLLLTRHMIPSLALYRDVTTS